MSCTNCYAKTLSSVSNAVRHPNACFSVCGCRPSTATRSGACTKRWSRLRSTPARSALRKSSSSSANPTTNTMQHCTGTAADDAPTVAGRGGGPSLSLHRRGIVGQFHGESHASALLLRQPGPANGVVRHTAIPRSLPACGLRYADVRQPDDLHARKRRRVGSGDPPFPLPSPTLPAALHALQRRQIPVRRRTAWPISTDKTFASAIRTGSRSST